MYEITNYTFNRLDELNKKIDGQISIEPSTNKKKKIDIFINGNKINSKEEDIKDNEITNSFFAKWLLW